MSLSKGIFYRRKVRDELFKYRDLTFYINRRPYKRSLSLQVKPSGQISVNVNKTLRVSLVKRFIDQHWEWIKNQERFYMTLKERYPQKTYSSGESFLFFGEILKLEIAQVKGRTRLSVEGSKILVQVNEREDIDHANLKILLREFYKSKGSLYIKEKVSFFANHMELYPRKVSVKSQKSCWGSCSSKGHLTVNWRLTVAPPAIIDYVIIHELAHLQHQNHSAHFWALVKKYCPDYRNCRQWLKDHAFETDFLCETSELYI